LSAQDDIEAFLVEIKATPFGATLDDEFSERMRKLYYGDDGRTIDVCDEVCAVVRRKDLTLLQRFMKLVPIFQKTIDSFGDEH
jgi:hypothetical protein